MGVAHIKVETSKGLQPERECFLSTPQKAPQNPSRDLARARKMKVLASVLTSAQRSAQRSALVLAQAATYLSGRIQASDMLGRAPDMRPNAALAMQKVLGQIEASNKLMSNREKVVQDITNPGPSAVNGGHLTQTGLKRVDRKHQASVDAMVREVCGRLLGKKVSEPSTSGEAQVWADAARFFHNRIQATLGECEGRKPDMSVVAATAMRTVLAQILTDCKKKL